MHYKICHLLTTTGDNSCCCGCTILDVPKRIWRFVTIGCVLKPLTVWCNWREVGAPDAFV